MRRKLKNLKNKSGHSENGSPRQLLDEAVYREKKNQANWAAGNHSFPPFWSPQFSGFSNGSRPKDSPIFLRAIHGIDNG